MSDDKYLLPKGAEPRPTALAPHPTEQRRATLAIGIALLTAFATGWYAWTEHQARIEEHQARIEAKRAFDAQAKEVERARRAAEDSAGAAARLADAAQQSLSITEAMAHTQGRSLYLAEQEFAAFRRAIHGGLQPLLWDAEAIVTGELLTVRIVNKGRMAARIADPWCGSGVLVREGSAEVRQIMDSKPEGVLRYSIIVPDGEERIRWPVFSRVSADFAARFPQLDVGSLRQPFSWVVACTVNYSDELDQADMASPHELRFCYEVQNGQGAVKVGPDISPCFQKLKKHPLVVPPR
jgi:hypothetical protein